MLSRLPVLAFVELVENPVEYFVVGLMLKGKLDRNKIVQAS
jgi:hypothetical protein